MNEDLKIFSSPKDDIPYYISLAGITFEDPTYHITRSQSEVSVIEYIVDGLGSIQYKGILQQVHKDQIYFLDQGERHDYWADINAPFTKIFMNISGIYCKRLRDAYGLAGKTIFSGIGLKSLFEQILQIIHSQMSELEMQTALQGIFMQILFKLSCTQAEAESDAEAVKLKTYLNNHLDRIVPSTELASVIYRSPDYCVKLFRREFGVTPYAYQLDHKMHIAQVLLTDTVMSVSQISESLGYSDMHYFSNLFKKKCGCRPLQFRKNKRS